MKKKRKKRKKKRSKQTSPRILGAKVRQNIHVMLSYANIAQIKSKKIITRYENTGNNRFDYTRTPL